MTTATITTRRQLLEGVPVTERRLELAGISTPVLDGGSGSPMVLLHGPGEHAPAWMEVIPKLVARYRVIAPDLPGHGASEVAGGPLTAERVLQWVDELIDRTCSSPPALVGQVVGGAMALRFAIGHGERLGRLILVDTLGLAPFQPAPEFASVLHAFLAEQNEATFNALWARCAFDIDRLRNRMGGLWDAFASYTLERARSLEVQAAQGALLEQFGFPPVPPEELRRITVPTALIWGRHHLPTSLTVAEAASVRYGWPLYVIENAGDPVLEQPEPFVEALLRAESSERSRLTANG
jgi:pimeloyl-ACP methyl ester carboxylesterase